MEAELKKKLLILGLGIIMLLGGLGIFSGIQNQQRVIAQEKASNNSNKVCTKVGNPTTPNPCGATNSCSETNSCAPNDKPGNLGIAVSCPVGNNFTVKCGTADDPVPGVCGHGGIGYPPICDPAFYNCSNSRYSDGLYKAIDVAVPSQVSAPVYLPFVNGEGVTWNQIQGLTPIGANAVWGYKLVYQTNYKDRQIRLDLTHLSGDTSKNQTLQSGETVGTYYSGIGHVHTAVWVDNQWVEARLGVGMCVK